MVKKIVVIGKPARRIEIVGKAKRRIEPEEFAAALGAKMTDEKIVARVIELRELLSEFGLTLSGYDPGVSANLKNKRGNGYFGEAISFDKTEWEWLEPLLIELRERRKHV